MALLAGSLAARSRMQTEENELTPRAHQWIDAIHGPFSGVRQYAPPQQAAPMAFKSA